MVRKGRFGPYAQHGGKVANLPRDMTMDEMTLADAVALLAEKGKVLKPKPGAGKRAKLASAKPVAAAKKPAIKKPAAKKAPAKKPTRTAAARKAV